MRQYLTFLLVLAVLITAGCVEEPAPGKDVTTVPTPVTSAVTTGVPGQNPTSTPQPAEMAYLANIRCAVGDKSETTYHCNGDIRIRSGKYEEVQVIARYADNNTYKSGTVAMGGNNPVSQPFILFPDLKYQGQTPDYFIKMDKKLYPVISGTAWSNLPAENQLQSKW
jgi:hypothetical protein